MKHPTEPSTRNTASTAPYLPIDLICLQDTHAVRINPDHKRSRGPRHEDVKIVRRAIRAYLAHQSLPADQGYPVPLYWLHDWLTYGPPTGPRTPQPEAAWEARMVMVSALNAPGSGMDVIAQRRMQHAS